MPALRPIISLFMVAIIIFNVNTVHLLHEQTTAPAPATIAPTSSTTTTAPATTTTTAPATTTTTAPATTTATAPATTTTATAPTSTATAPAPTTTASTTTPTTTTAAPLATTNANPEDISPWVIGRTETLNTCFHALPADSVTKFNYKKGALEIVSCRTRSCPYTLVGYSFSLNPANCVITVDNATCTDDKAPAYLAIIGTADRIGLLA